MSRAIAACGGMVLMGAVGWAAHQRSDHARAACPTAPAPHLEVTTCGDEAQTRSIATDVLALPATAQLELRCWSLREHGWARFAIATAIRGERGVEAELVLANEARAVETRRPLGAASSWSFELLHDEQARPGQVATVITAHGGGEELAFDVRTLAKLDPTVLARP